VAGGGAEIYNVFTIQRQILTGRIFWKAFDLLRTILESFPLHQRLLDQTPPSLGSNTLCLSSPPNLSKTFCCLLGVMTHSAQVAKLQTLFH
jgi:hypothetical protein